MENDPAEIIARKTREIARSSYTEEDLKIGVQALLDEYLKDLGIEQEVQYERRIYKSRRADTIYPSVVRV